MGKRRGSRGKGDITKNKKKTRISTHVMEKSAVTMVNVLSSWSIALLSVGKTPVDVECLIAYIQDNPVEVERILDDNDSPDGTSLDVIPLAVYRSFRAGYLRVADVPPLAAADAGDGVRDGERWWGASLDLREVRLRTARVW